ncbi:MAG: ACT domain-containing protein, partial [Leptolyngbyaceae cyanobacterium CAN_BIN12]|nr:ACT domain-containing protein [Leptolyngbyaceae cyanobacterium CAN_BIN12]
EITSDEMLELASLGAKVLHPRAVEIARNFGVPLVVRSSWTDEPGTWVMSPQPKPRSLDGLELTRAVDAVEFDTDQAKVSLLRVPDRPGVAARLFGEIASQALNVDLIIQSIHEGNTNDIAFTVTHQSLRRAEAVANAIIPALCDGNPAATEAEVMVEQQIAKVSIAGAGMIGRPGVAAQMFTTLAAAGVNIQMISTSEVKVSCVVAAADCDRAIAALCNTFNLTSSPYQAIGRGEPRSLSPIGNSNKSSYDSALPPVRGVALDQKQARIAIRAIPDRPGMAARVFQLLALQNISVDMIIQSQRCRVIGGAVTRDIAFTVAQMDGETARLALEAARPELDCGDIVLDAAIAKVSIVGSGMVQQPGVAARMFAALSQHQINIQMIATSEIKVSCVVAEEDGVKALQVIHAAFELSGDRQIQVSA